MKRFSAGNLLGVWRRGPGYGWRAAWLWHHPCMLCRSKWFNMPHELCIDLMRAYLPLISGRRPDW